MEKTYGYLTDILKHGSDDSQMFESLKRVLAVLYLPVPGNFEHTPAIGDIIMYLFIGFCGIAMYIMLFDFTYTFGLLVYTWLNTSTSVLNQSITGVSTIIILGLWYVLLRKRLRDANLSLKYAWAPVIFPILLFSIYGLHLNTRFVTILLGLYIIGAGCVAMGATLTATDYESQHIRRSQYGLNKY